MKSIARMEIRDVPDKSFISAEENETDIHYIYQKLATIPADKNHGTEEVSMYACGGFPGWTENTHRLVYVYKTEDIIDKWSK